MFKPTTTTRGAAFRAPATAAIILLAFNLPGFPAHADQLSDLHAFRACTAIKTAQARLACYDKAAASFDFESTRKQLIEARKARAEADRLRAEAKNRRVETAKLRADAEARKTELARAKAAEKARLEAEARHKAELEKRKVSDFGLENSPVKTVARIDSTIAHVKKPRPGSIRGVTVQLENGQTWYQTDDRRTGRLKPGMAVHITEGAFGGYMLVIEKNHRSFYVKRIG